jgi:hypothetical protein
MSRVYAARELEWRDNRLVVQGGGRRSPMTEIVPDAEWTDMWRVRRLDGSLTDMVNRSRARDAAKVILLGVLNSQETAIASPSIAFEPEDATELTLSE